MSIIDASLSTTRHIDETHIDNARTDKTRYVLILWGEKFDEDVATLFTTAARREGLCVKVVGVTGTQATGRNGLVIAADLTLGQAASLAKQAVCVVVPCHPSILQHLENDPRVPELIQQANANHALFVFSNHDALDRSSLRQLQIDPTRLIYYADFQSLSDSTHEIVQSLLPSIFDSVGNGFVSSTIL